METGNGHVDPKDIDWNAPFTVIDDREKDWFWADKAIFEPGISPNARLVYLCLCRIDDNRTGVAVATFPKIAKLTGLSQSTVQRVLRLELQPRGMVRIESGSEAGTTNHYHPQGWRRWGGHTDQGGGGHPDQGGPANPVIFSPPQTPPIPPTSSLTPTTDIPNGGHTDHPSRNSKNLLRQSAREVLDFLNAKAGRSFRAVTATGAPTTSLKLIEARLRDGATVANCRGVIAMRVRKWLGDPKMNEFLRPSTLFNATKFESYLGERPPADPDEDDDE